MDVVTPRSVSLTTFGLDVKSDLPDTEPAGSPVTFGSIGFEARHGARSCWIVAAVDGRDVLALRLGAGAGELTGPVTRSDTADGFVLEFSSALGALRTKVAFPAADRAMIRCTTSLLPARDVVVPFWPRDLYVLGGAAGTVHTAQRGPRSGIVYATTQEADPWTLFYFQNFSSLTDYFEATKKSPADSVGGRWPELGYAAPSGEDCVLPGSRDLVVSDVFLTLVDSAPESQAQAAASYLDLLAGTYLCIERPPVAYHDWPGRAERTLRDLSFSPKCTYVRDGARYAMPYVADAEKPPESMVQFTLAVNAGEYARWGGDADSLAAVLGGTPAAFFDEQVGSVVRWLPGADFGASQAEANMNHDDMDSWYLHHALFNLQRLAAGGDARARDLFVRSLPFAIRVARRFNYRWPVFFNLKTLDVVRAESEPGKGGEFDVGGLYALVMIHAHELLGDPEYLAEAEQGLLHLEGLGFRLGYQMNTTGFAAEAAMRLWKKTRKRAYLELSEICMANLFDNMWLWQCGYGRARHYRTFFGLLPLHDAPYLAAYEELEAQAKFHDYLTLGGEDVRPSLRLLLAEYQRHSLDRGWYYFPDALPADLIAEKPRNGEVARELSIPIEDLQDGWKPSGEVGQEIYGSGIAFVYTTRHYARIPEIGCLAFCDYPVYDFRPDAKSGRASLRAGGDARCSGELRIIPQDPNMEPLDVTVTTRAGDVTVPLRGSHTAEGHAAFSVRGGQSVEIAWALPATARVPGVVIGGMTRREAGRP